VELALASRECSLFSSTPDLTIKGDRVDEILWWINGHKELRAVAWIAVDDMDLMGMNGKLDAAHFVRTDDTFGLTKAKTAEAIKKLSAQLTPPESASSSGGLAGEGASHHRQATCSARR